MAGWSLEYVLLQVGPRGRGVGWRQWALDTWPRPCLSPAVQQCQMCLSLGTVDTGPWQAHLEHGHHKRLGTRSGLATSKTFFQPLILFLKRPSASGLLIFSTC